MRADARDFRNHPRDWRGFSYVYPVVSRRSRGLSIGINLNPDTACNFDCIYCQVDRTGVHRPGHVEPNRLEDELKTLLVGAVEGTLFAEPEFAETPLELRRLNDIAFSGDGEPTTSPVFAEAVGIAAGLKAKHAPDSVKLILITDACYLTKPNVEDGLRIMDQANGEVWAKLDAGTEAYYQLVNRPNFPLAHVIENITHAARVRPVAIQSLFMRVRGAPPPDDEIVAFADRLGEIVDGGGHISAVQVYTVARRPAQDWVTALSDEEVDRIAAVVGERTGLPVSTYYGSTVDS